MSVHGHEVLQMMLSSNTSFTPETLVAAIEDKFGTDTRFHTCSASEMTAAELVYFLEKKGKFIPTSTGFNTSEHKICNH